MVVYVQLKQFFYRKVDFMQAIAYEGVFRGGQFYSAGIEVKIPEEQRIIVTIFNQSQKSISEKLAIWEETLRMIEESAHENHLLTEEFFSVIKAAAP